MGIFFESWGNILILLFAHGETFSHSSDDSIDAVGIDICVSLVNEPLPMKLIDGVIRSLCVSFLGILSRKWILLYA